MKKILYLFFALLISGAAFSQTRVATYEVVKTGKFPYKRYDNDPLNSRWYTLPNGLTVVLSVNKSSPRAYTMIATKAGSKNDPKDHTGLAHYLEHMLFKGTDKYGTSDFAKEKPYLDQIDELYEEYNHTTDEVLRTAIYARIDSISGLASKFSIANEYDKMMQSLGAEGTNAFTSFEQTVYINDIPVNQIHRWLEIESERFRNPVLRIFHTELEAVYEEKNIGMDNDQNKVYEALFASLFPNHPYGTQTTIGTIEHLKNPSLKKIREYYNSWYVPNNMAVIMAGDFNPDDVIEMINNHFGAMQNKPIPGFVHQIDMPHGVPQVVHINGPDAESVHIGFRMPGAGTKEADLIRLCDLLLNNSKAGLIDLNLVKQQKVLRAGSSPDVLKDYSVFNLYGSPKEGQTLDEVKDLLLSQIELLKKGVFDQNLIKSIVLNNELNKIKEYEENTGRAYSVLDAFCTGVDWMDYLNSNYNMSRFSVSEISEFAKEWFTNGYTIVYKHKGEDSTVNKIQKPLIHPVELNRDKTSAFVQDILDEAYDELVPVFVDFEKGYSKLKVNNNDLWYIKNTDNRLFNLYYVLDIGRLHDVKTTFAVNYLQFLGTSKYTSDELSRKFYSLGCSFGISAGDKQSYVYLNGPEENFDEALILFEELLADAKPDQKALDDLVQRTLKQRTDNKLNKRVISQALRSYANYGPQNPFNYQLSEAQLKSLSGDELCGIIKKLTSFNHKIFYCGARGQGDVAATLAKLHKTPAKFIPSPEPKVFTPRTTTTTEVYFANYDGMVQADVNWFKRSNMFDAKELALTELYNAYFGGGMGSVVFQTIRESKALAYSTYAYYVTAPEKDKYNSVIAFVGTQADKFHEAIAAMNELLKDLPQTPEAFELAKSSIKNRIETSRTLKTDVLFTIDQQTKLGLDKDQNELVYKAIDDLTFEDVTKFHNQKMSGGSYIYSVVAASEKVSEKDLTKYGKVFKVSLKDIFGY